MFLNKVQIIGNLTRDPELRTLPSGVKVVSFSLATNRVWKDQSGAKKEASDFHNAVAFGKIAEIIAQYAKKGSSLYIEGRLQNRSWDGPDGQKRYKTEVFVENFQFGPRPAGSGGRYDGGSQTPSTGSSKADEIETIEYPAEESSEDIPF